MRSASYARRSSATCFARRTCKLLRPRPFRSRGLVRWGPRFRIGSPAFLVAVRVIPGLGGTLATQVAAAFKVPIFVQVWTMSVIAIPICTLLLAIFGDRVRGSPSHAYYMSAHRPHVHMHALLKPHMHMPPPPVPFSHADPGAPSLNRHRRSKRPTGADRARCARVAGAEAVALDTEFHNERSYAALVLMVVQLAFDDEVAVIDPLTRRRPVGRSPKP